MNPVLRLQGASKSFAAGALVVDNVSFDAAAGELVVLLGESGCGKTTTLKMINRLVEPSSGSIEVNGQDVASVDDVELRRSIGYVFQEVGLFPHMTVGENVGITPVLLGWEESRVRERVEVLLGLVKLSPADYRDRMPSELSGGQRQRVGFARALATSPSVMLLDEPFGALDPITKDALQREFMDLRRQLKLTGVLVTHDMTEALLMADRILVMKEGAVVQYGTPAEIVKAPASPYVCELMDMPKRQAKHLESLVF